MSATLYDEIPSFSGCSRPSGTSPVSLAFYWDIENCGVPARKSAIDVVQMIRDRFGGLGSEVDFVCVCDVNKERSELINDLNLAQASGKFNVNRIFFLTFFLLQVTVVHVSATSKNAADEKLKSLLRRFGATHTSPGTVVLLSSELSF